jgi:hypothetical protein
MKLKGGICRALSETSNLTAKDEVRAHRDGGRVA